MNTTTHTPVTESFNLPVDHYAEQFPHLRAIFRAQDVRRVIQLQSERATALVYQLGNGRFACAYGSRALFNRWRKAR